MSIQQGMTTSFKQELFEKVHDFAVAGDTFKLALYTEDADIGSATTVYSATGEVSGTGYTAGGASLTNIAPTSSGQAGYTDFADLTFSTVTFTVASTAPRAALIYNSSQGNRAVAVLDFGFSQLRTAADLVITFPTADSTSAMLRVL